MMRNTDEEKAKKKKKQNNNKTKAPGLYMHPLTHGRHQFHTYSYTYSGNRLVRQMQECERPRAKRCPCRRNLNTTHTHKHITRGIFIESEKQWIYYIVVFEPYCHCSVDRTRSFSLAPNSFSPRPTVGWCREMGLMMMMMLRPLAAIRLCSSALHCIWHRHMRWWWWDRRTTGETR